MAMQKKQDQNNEHIRRLGGIHSRLIKMLSSQERHSNFNADHFSRFNCPSVVTASTDICFSGNKTTPTIIAKAATTQASVQPFPPGVIPYNNFYITTMGFQPGVANNGTASNCNGAAISVGGNLQNIQPSYQNANDEGVSRLPVSYNNSINLNNTIHLPLPTQQQLLHSTDSSNFTVLKPDNGKNKDNIPLNPNAVSASQFVQYAIGHAKSSGIPVANQFIPLRRTDSEQSTIKVINTKLSSNYGLGIYSECPFLRPITLLRGVQFAAPTITCYQYPDPDNMVRTLRDQADQKVASIPLLAILSGAKPTAASLGFQTDYLTHSFSFEMDAATLRLLSEQAKPNNQSLVLRYQSSDEDVFPAVSSLQSVSDTQIQLPKPVERNSFQMRADRYRVVLRLAWATNGLYMPRSSPGQNPSRSLAGEILPRCLAIKVARRNVPLPDPIFHGGQAHKLGHRLKFSIDITDKIPFRQNASARGEKNIEIELSWLHAPLEDHAIPLLEMVGTGSCPPLVNYIVNLPLVQLTLDRVQTIPQFVQEFSTAVSGIPVPDTIATEPRTRNQFPYPTPDALHGTYDFCSATERVIPIEKNLAMLRSKLGSNDDLLCDDWIPISLLCPLTLTRIEVPVRSINCDHLQCYDLKSYLTINKKRPRWACPVCSSPAPFRDLRRDDFFVQVLSDQAFTNVERVQVDAEGRYRKAREDSVDDLSIKENIKQQSLMNSRQNPHNIDNSLTHSNEANTPACKSEKYENPGHFSQTPIDDDCVMVIDDDDDYASEAMRTDTPTNSHFTIVPQFTSPLPSINTSPNLLRSEGITNSSADPMAAIPPLQLGPGNVLVPDTSSMFVDLTASSDEESNAPSPSKFSKRASTLPPPPQQQPLVSASLTFRLKPSITAVTGNDSQAPVSTPPISTPAVSNQAGSAAMSTTAMDLNSNLIKGINSSSPHTSLIPKPIQMRPPILIAPIANQTAAMAAISAAINLKYSTNIIDTNIIESSSLPPLPSPTSVSSSPQINQTFTTLSSKTTLSRPHVSIAPSPRINSVTAFSPSSRANTNNNNTSDTSIGINNNSNSPTSETSWKRTSGGSGRFKFTVKRRCTSPVVPEQPLQPVFNDSCSTESVPPTTSSIPAAASLSNRMPNGKLSTSTKSGSGATARLHHNRKRGRTRLYTDDDSDSTPSSSDEEEDETSEELSDDDDDGEDSLWTPSKSKRSSGSTTSSGRLRSTSLRHRFTKS